MDSPNKDPSSIKEPAYRKDPTAVLTAGLQWTPILPLIPAIVYAASGEGDADALSVLAVSIMAAVAAFAVGSILGFIFALPRTVEQTKESGVLATNSNLDQVSDWLTKILVGIGLIELGKISNGVGDLGVSVASALGGGSGAETFALAILIYSVIDGFLLCYLWTRIVVSPGLKKAAEDLIVRSERLAEAVEIGEALVEPIQPLPAPLPKPVTDRAANVPGGEG